MSLAPAEPAPHADAQALWRLDATQLLQGYRAGTFTPVDAVHSCLERITRWQPHTNAFVRVDADAALLSAQASTRRWANGAAQGPLDGVPLSLKDSLHAAGLPTTWGSALLRSHVPAHDELPVARLRAAGAIVLGKTNLPEFAMQGYTANLVAGVTRNPWDVALTPGGSSGGAAAAVAAGCGPLALATDGGGSTRRPASHTGLVGFKPSSGRVPRAGGLPEIFLGHEVVGTLARSVRDVVLMDSVLSGQTVPAQPGATGERILPGHRILYVPRFAQHPVDAGIAALTQRAAHDLAALGFAVEEAPAWELAEDVNALWPTLSAAGLAWMLSQPGRFAEFAGTPPDTRLCGEAAQAALQAGRSAGATTLFEVLAAVHAMQQQLDAVFAAHDFILTPAAAALPWTADQTHPAQIGGVQTGPRGHAVFTAFANAAGLPAIALPCGQVRGLPVGLQLVGRPGADAALLATALRYEAQHPWAGAWPSLPAA
jgi:aspartyl-tRNA(Asn)/glutamyl-tRNA(Gln) amidotransferase subunit A